MYLARRDPITKHVFLNQWGQHTSSPSIIINIMRTIVASQMCKSRGHTMRVNDAISCATFLATNGLDSLSTTEEFEIILDELESYLHDLVNL